MILDAALEAFARRGFEGASIREITGAAGLGHNLVRHYFGSKEDLWRATIHHALDPGAEQIVAVLSAGHEGSPEETMRAGLRVLLSGIDLNPDAIRLLVAEALRGGPRFDEIYEEVLAPVGDVLVSYFAEAGSGLADVDPRVVGLYVFGAVFGSLSFEGLLQRLELGPDTGSLDAAMTDDLLELVLNGLLGRK